jgi:ribonuclease Z
VSHQIRGGSGLLPVLIALSMLGPGCTDAVLRLVGDQVEKNLTFDLPASLPDGLHVLVCGAGGPLPDRKRSSACLLVIAGETVFMVDAGSSSARNMALAGLQPGRIERVFLTHFHSDHFDGLGEVATLRWAQGSWAEPLPVHGPDGVAEIVGGLNLAYRRDQTYRTAHHGLDLTSPASHGLSATAFRAPSVGDAPVVFEAGDLRVTAFAVDHHPVDPAIGYRVEYKGRSIAISGDTSKSDNLIAQSQGVDVLFHEALSKRLVGVMNQSAQNVGDSTMAKITADILDYHASPVEAAESAAEANASALVIYHVVPPLPLAPMERIFKAGMSDAYDGPIEISVDGTFISLPAGSDEIEIDHP